MKKTTFRVGLVTLLASFTACAGEAEPEAAPQEGPVALQDEVSEIKDNLRAVGYPESELLVLEDGRVVAGGDAIVSLKASREMVRGLYLETEEQYRTTNLVSANVETICIDGSAFSGTLSNGLNGAISNYNSLGLSFEMVRTSGSTAGCDAVIDANLVGGSGGSAGFPSGGLPFDEINIGTQIASFGVDVATHVIEHELGHCIGFRHSDFFDRSISCGTGGNEGDGGVGAIHIPGTPTGAVINGSFMNSCFNSGSTGVFTDSDLVALDELYGSGGGGGDGGGDGGVDVNSCLDTNSCGGQAPGGCFCDRFCRFFGDCCSDGPC